MYASFVDFPVQIVVAVSESHIFTFAPRRIYFRAAFSLHGYIQHSQYALTLPDHPRLAHSVDRLTQSHFIYLFRVENIFGTILPGH